MKSPCPEGLQSQDTPYPTAGKGRGGEGSRAVRSPAGHRSSGSPVGGAHPPCRFAPSLELQVPLGCPVETFISGLPQRTRSFPWAPCGALVLAGEGIVLRLPGVTGFLRFSRGN